MSSSALGVGSSVPRCFERGALRQERVSCQAVSPVGWRTTKQLLRLKRNRGRLGSARRTAAASLCWPPHFANASKSHCCSQRHVGQGNLACWKDRPEAPWWQLCCDGGQGLGNGIRASSQLMASFGRAERFTISFKRMQGELEDVRLSIDRPCFPAQPGDKCAVFFLAYHKTGNWLLTQLMKSLLMVLLTPELGVPDPDKDAITVAWRRTTDLNVNLVPLAQIPADYAGIHQLMPDRFGELPLDWNPWFQPLSPVLVSMGENLPELKLPPGGGPGPLPSSYRGRVVHFVREPVEVVASAFRNHMRSSLQEHPHWKEFHALGCFACSHAAWHEIFRRCGFGCSYLALLQHTAQNRSLTEALGLEYVRSQSSLQNMLRNTVAWGSNAHVLHLSPEHFRAPHLEGSARCLARFMLGAVEGDGWAVLEEAVDAVVNRILFDASTWDSEHATFRDPRWAKVDLRGPLLQHPLWGRPLRQAGRLLRRIFERQAKLYGCPTP